MCLRWEPKELDGKVWNTLGTPKRMGIYRLALKLKLGNLNLKEWNKNDSKEIISALKREVNGGHVQ